MNAFRIVRTSYAVQFPPLPDSYAKASASAWGAFIFEGPKTKQKALGKFNKCTAYTPRASHKANLLQHSSPQAARQFSPAAVVAYSVLQHFVLKINVRFHHPDLSDIDPSAFVGVFTVFSPTKSQTQEENGVIINSLRLDQKSDRTR